MGTPNVKSTKSRKARRGGRSPVKGFARSVIHYITKKRIFPKTAKCFPLKGRKKKPPEQLLLPLPDVNPPPRRHRRGGVARHRPRAGKPLYPAPPPP